MGDSSWLALASLPVIYSRQMPIEGSIVPFLFCATLRLFATASISIFMATFAHTVLQLGF